MSIIVADQYIVFAIVLKSFYAIGPVWIYLFVAVDVPGYVVLCQGIEPDLIFVAIDNHLVC